jgi:hypothetical protein
MMYKLDRGGNWCRGCGRVVKKKPGLDCPDCKVLVLCGDCDVSVRNDIKVIRKIVWTASSEPVGGK